MRSARSESTGRLIFGLVVLGLGVLFMLDHMGLVDSSQVLEWWPALLLGMGLSRLGGLFGRRRVTSGLILSVIGAWLLLRNLGLLDVGPWDFWPIVLIVLGTVMVSNALRRNSAATAPGAPGGSFGPPPTSGEASGPQGVSTGAAWHPSDRGPATDPSSRISGFAMFSSIERRVTSQSFRGGDLGAMMGGLEIDLRGAQINGEPAVIDLFVMMGGVDIQVPEHWAVTSEVVPFMGGIEDRARTPAGAPSGHLVLRGFVMMGSVEIKN